MACGATLEVVYLGKTTKLRGPPKASNTKLSSLHSLFLTYSLGDRVVERLQVGGLIIRVW